MVDEKIKEKNYNLVSYLSLAYNCFLIDKIMIFISFILLVFLLYFVEVELQFIPYLLKSISVICFTFTLLVSMIILKQNNKLLEAILNNSNIKTDIQLLDHCVITSFFIGIVTFILLGIIK